MKNALVSLFGALVLYGCSASQQFPAIPVGLDTANVPRQTVEMKARRYEFLPEEIRVKAGTLVTLKITATDATHGFDLGAFGIDERLEKDSVVTVQFYAGQKGEYGFRCSHFCGMGHLSMTGKVIVE